LYTGTSTVMTAVLAYAYMQLRICVRHSMYHHQVKQQYIIVLLLNRKIQQFILWRFVCYIPTLQL